MNPTEMSTKLIGEYLKNPKNPLKARFRALFTLKNINTSEAIRYIGDCFADESDLLKHELAYCLGQMQQSEAIPILENLIDNKNNSAIVRHEAGEALGAIGTERCRSIVASFTNDPSKEVAETCILSLGRIRDTKAIKEGRKKDPARYSSQFFSIDPAYPLDSSHSVQSLGQIVASDSSDLYTRYAAMFQLRNINTKESAMAITKGFKCRRSALLRHEVAFVLGQMQQEIAAEALSERLADLNESAMVRHECAEALGAIGTPWCKDVLEKFLNDPERIVRESCEVALDICEYETSNEFQYANGFEIVRIVSSSTELLSEDYMYNGEGNEH